MVKQLPLIALLLLAGCSDRPSADLFNGSSTANLWSDIEQKAGVAKDEFQQTWDQNAIDVQRDIAKANEDLLAKAIPFELPEGGEFKLPELGAPTIPDINIPDPFASDKVDMPADDRELGNKVVQVYSGGAGSGVVVGYDGEIVTNAHVIADRFQINVVANGKTYPAQLIKIDSAIDLALIDINAVTTPVKFGSAADGDYVVTEGNPLDRGIIRRDGTLQSSTICPIYGKNGSREFSYLAKAGISCYRTPLGTVDPGNSGGAAFNQYEEAIGIVSAQDSQGQGVVIPAEVVQSFLGN
jgi:S1-C subfamily serine protease